MDTTILNEVLELKALILSQNILSKGILNLTETAFYLEVSKSHLYKLTCSGKIPHYKPNGKKLYFKRSELDVWTLSNRTSSKDEIEQMASDYILKNERIRL
ncbi:MAG: helix-turn-helix domain-containing protein [Prolixibacteraceae bacterium]|jgi:excisionase family DNA binding protein|nr:helix-turn-helix domain-containing protein [Prolixibacteraceae bacterium]